MNQKRLQVAPTQVGELVKSISCSATSGLRMYYLDLRKSQADRYFVRFTQGRGYRMAKQNVSVDQSDLPMLMSTLEDFYSKTKKVMSALGTEAEGHETEVALAEKQTEESKETTEAVTDKIPVRKPVVIPGPQATVKYETPSGTTIEIVECFSMISSNLRRKWFVDLKKTATRGHFITFKQKTDAGNQTIYIDLVDMDKIMQSLRELHRDMQHLQQRRAEIETETQEGRQALIGEAA